MNALVWYQVDVEHLHDHKSTWWPGRHRVYAHLVELNDRLWGEGKWVQCYSCPRDDAGHGVFHHRDAHG